MLRRLCIFIFLLACSLAYAKITFEQVPFEASSLRKFEDLQQACQDAPQSSFWCNNLEASLTLIPTKGNDYIFNEKGELLALFTKIQKGQDLRGNYAINNANNLVPAKQALPAGALLIDGEYVEAQNVKSSWERLSDIELQGNFQFQLGDVDVAKTILLSHISHTLKITVTADGPEASEETPVIQYVLPGLAQGNSAPLIKIGQGGTFSVNPGLSPIDNPSYLALQTSDSRGNAFVLRPREQGMQGRVLQTTQIALEKPLGPNTTMSFDEFAGPNELVRYYQEDYFELPGLFKPNIFGQISLWVLKVLEILQQYIGVWGLSIIALTLLFRVLIWPLIHTQTKSMFAMQALQPKMQELQKKYKDDREKLTQETMKLYQENKVNPAGGCLPMLVQMPLFFILWRVFVNFEFNEGFLWVPDLGQPDPTYILPILYVGVMVAQSFLSAKGNKQMLQQQLIINVVFVFLFVTFPSGVILYYVVSMLVQLLQYWLIQRSQGQPAKA
jgi:YidC/Oxa1 family membrane protein insertase